MTFRINNLIGFGARTAGNNTLQISNIATGVQALSSLSAYTFSSASFGAVPGGGEKRWIAVEFGCRSSTFNSITSVTIGGVAATILLTQNGGAGGVWTVLAIREVASGTSGDVVINLGGGVAFGMAVSVYRIISNDSADLTLIHDFATDTIEVSGVLSMNIDCPAGGVIIGVTASKNGDQTTWAGLNEDYEVDTVTREWVSMASQAFAAQQTSLNITMTNADTTPTDYVGAAVSWGPNGAT